MRSFRYKSVPYRILTPGFPMPPDGSSLIYASSYKTIIQGTGRTLIFGPQFFLSSFLPLRMLEILIHHKSHRKPDFQFHGFYACRRDNHPFAFRGGWQLSVIRQRYRLRHPPENLLPHIFDRSFTTRKEDGGNGLGLFLVKTIAQERRESVRAESLPGKGCRITLLPPNTVNISFTPPHLL